MARDTKSKKRWTRSRRPRRRIRKPHLRYEHAARRRGFFWIAGVDEAGRGPLAGPVVASAVFLKDLHFAAKIADSKRLSPKKRELAYGEILEKAVVGVGIVSEKVIDRINILSATERAMEKAIASLIFRIRRDSRRRSFSDALSPEELFYFLVDGKVKLSLPYSYQTIVGGDGSSLSIACASIVSKVVRDRIMADFDRRFPQYGFAQHKGYGTAQHLARLCQWGPSPIHRRSFRPLR